MDDRQKTSIVAAGMPVATPSWTHRQHGHSVRELAALADTSDLSPVVLFLSAHGLNTLLTVQTPSMHGLFFSTTGSFDRIIIIRILLLCLTHVTLIRGSSSPFDVKDGLARMPTMYDARMPTMLGGEARSIRLPLVPRFYHTSRVTRLAYSLLLLGALMMTSGEVAARWYRFASAYVYVSPFTSLRSLDRPSWWPVLFPSSRCFGLCLLERGSHAPSWEPRRRASCSV
jgi:hypothetical protein